MQNTALLFGHNKTPALVGQADRNGGLLNTILFFEVYLMSGRSLFGFSFSFSNLVAVMVAFAFNSIYAYTLNLVAVTVFAADAVNTDTAHFRSELFDNLAVELSALLHCTIEHCSEFVTAHHAVTGVVAIRIAFDDACSCQLANVFICPVVFSNIRC